MPHNRAIWLLVPVLFGSACASRSEPVAVAPPPSQTVRTPAPSEQTPLQAPAGALRAADRVQLTGLELGTMWTFENPPREYWRRTYNFTPTQQWLDQVRLASVRYGESCSASFVSPNGLAMTNHHCARECVEAISREGTTDYVVEGFYARTRAEEKLCPNLFLDQLVEIQNVTTRVQGVTRALTDTAGARAREAELERIEGECEQQSNLTCQVVSLYHGGQFQLYKYRRYQPVKLVFAPELQAGFFGGDPDNFTYPRYDLDVSFVRAYNADGNTPLASPQFFQWSSTGAREGDLVFVTGNPGSTSRQVTFSRVLYEREYRHPFLIQFLQAQRDLLAAIAARGPEAEQAVREDLFSVENSLKAYQGQFAGLQDTLLLGQKIRWEREFRERVQANPTLRAQYGDVWDRLADLQLQKLRVSPRLNLANAQWIGAPHLVYASQLIFYLRNRDKPDAQRPQALQGANLARVEQMLRGPTQLDPQIAESLLATQLQMAARWLLEDDILRQAFVRAGENPVAAARRLIQQTRIADPAFRQQLIAAGPAALDTTSDPALRAALVMLQGHDTLNTRWNEITAAETAQQVRLAEALFAVFGTNIPPDATFTLRISDGVVRRYPYNGTIAPAFTTFYGMFGRAASFNNEMPFALPKSFAERRAAINMATSLNFVSTNDITGGNSGSPIIDREARVVGLAFDGNIESLPNEFLYRNIAGRAVSVHSAGITEALRNIYRADALLRELIGSTR